MSTLFVTPFLIMLFGSIPFVLGVGETEPRTPAQRRSARIGGILFGLGMLYFGLGCLIGGRLSARPEITGVVENIQQSGGRYSSSSFKVVQTDASSVPLTAGYHGDKLHEADVVRATYLDFDKSVLSLTILHGQNIGWTLREPEDEWISLLMIPLAFMGFYMAYSCGREPAGGADSEDALARPILNRQGKLIRHLRRRRARTGSIHR